MASALRPETDEEIDEMAEGLTSLDAWIHGWRPQSGPTLQEFWRQWRRENSPEVEYDDQLEIRKDETNA